MQIEEFWEAYTSSEKELFQRSCRRLLKHTFIVRDKDEENKKAYYFISKRPEPFSAYFRYIGFDIVVDRENGVVMLRNCADAGEKADNMLQWLEKNVRHLDIPTSLQEFGVPASDLDVLVDAGMQVTRLLNNNLRPVTPADARALYSQIL